MLSNIGDVLSSTLRQIVVAHDCVAAIEELSDQVRSDKPSRTRNKDLHREPIDGRSRHGRNRGGQLAPAQEADEMGIWRDHT